MTKIESFLQHRFKGGDWPHEGFFRYNELCTVQSRRKEVGSRERFEISFITGGEDGYVRLCFFDEEYFKKVTLFEGWE